MKGALFFATAASAANLPRFYFNAANSTAPANGLTTGAAVPSGVASPTGGVSEEEGAGLTTLTVLTTSVHTVISCAPTVTDCPADETAISALPSESLSVILVTDTIVLTETVCPVSEASSIASSVQSDADAGSITGTTLSETANSAVPTIPTGTVLTTSQPFEPIETAVSSSSEEEIAGTTTATLTQTTHIAVTKTYTITMGEGDNTSVTVGYSVTSEASEVIVTVTNTDLNSGVTGSVGGDEPELTTTDEGTSTTTQTTKVTSTITVHRSTATEENSPVQTDSGNGSTTGGDAGSDGECGCSNETITVTVPAETIYVTVGADVATSTTTADASENTGSAGEDEDEEYDEDDDEACDAEEDDFEAAATDAVDATETDVVVEVTATVMPTPLYPINGTNTEASHGTGFATGTAGAARPTGHRHRGHRFGSGRY